VSLFHSPSPDKVDAPAEQDGDDRDGELVEQVQVDELGHEVRPAEDEDVLVGLLPKLGDQVSQIA